MTPKNKYESFSFFNNEESQHETTNDNFRPLSHKLESLAFQVPREEFSWGVCEDKMVHPLTLVFVFKNEKSSNLEIRSAEVSITELIPDSMMGDFEPTECVPLQDEEFMNMSNEEPLSRKAAHCLRHVRLTDRKIYHSPIGLKNLPSEDVLHALLPKILEMSRFYYPDSASKDLIRFGVVTGVQTATMQRLDLVESAKEYTFDELWKRAEKGETDKAWFLESSGVVAVELQCFHVERLSRWHYDTWTVSGPSPFKREWSDASIVKTEKLEIKIQSDDESDDFRKSVYRSSSSNLGGQQPRPVVVTLLCLAMVVYAAAHEIDHLNWFAERN